MSSQEESSSLYVKERKTKSQSHNSSRTIELLQDELRKRNNMIDLMKRNSKEGETDSFAEERKNMKDKLMKAEQDIKELKRRINEAASISKKKLEEAGATVNLK